GSRVRAPYDQAQCREPDACRYRRLLSRPADPRAFRGDNDREILSRDEKTYAGCGGQINGKVAKMREPRQNLDNALSALPATVARTIVSEHTLFSILKDGFDSRTRDQTPILTVEYRRKQGFEGNPVYAD